MDQLNLILSWLVPIVAGAISGWAATAIKLGRYAQMVDDLKENMKECQAKNGATDIKIIELATKIDERTRAYSSTLTKRKSPLSLTEAGDELLILSGGKHYVEEHFGTLLEMIEAKKPQTAYDIQECSKSVLEAQSAKPSFNHLKNYLFKEGRMLEDLITVMGIFLRDAVLAHKKIHVGEIDKSDPNQQNIPIDVPTESDSEK